MAIDPQKIYSLCLNLIRDGETDNLNRCLILLGVRYREERDLMEMIHPLLNSAKDNNSPDSVRTIIDTCSLVDSTGEFYNPYYRFFLYIQFDEELLKFVIQSLEDDHNFAEMISKFSEMEECQEIYVACQRCEKVFGDQTLEDLIPLYENILAKDCIQVKEYLENRIRELREHGLIPEWIVASTKYGRILPTQEDLEKDVDFPEIVEYPEDIDDFIELITKYMITEEPDRFRERLKEDFGRMARENPVLLEDYILSIYKEVHRPKDAKEIEQFRVFGPLNPDPSGFKNSAMFFAEEIDPDMPDYESDWFLNSCDKCHLRILHFWYATRIPLMGGGWSNCFCSWKCVREFVIEMGYPEKELRMILTSIDNAENDMKRHGIYERRED
jgi:hypothetical protein